MVELVTYSSIDWFVSGIFRDKAEALKARSPILILFNF